jgi:hypothetical protein
MATYYAANNVAVGDGAGTIGDPWSLQEALNNASWAANDILYLRGGTYQGKFTCTLAVAGVLAEEDKPIVMSYPGEWAVINGSKTTTIVGAVDDDEENSAQWEFASMDGMGCPTSLIIDNEVIRVCVIDGVLIGVERGLSSSGVPTPIVPHAAGTTVYFSGSTIGITAGTNTIYQDFEVFNSSGLRDEQITLGSAGMDTGISMVGASDGNTFQFLEIHDNGSAMFVGGDTSNTEFYALHTYNNGVRLVDGGWAGIGIYAENASGYSRIYGNIHLNNTGNLQLRGTEAPYQNGDLRDTICAGAGIFHLEDVGSEDIRFNNLLVGSGSAVSDEFNAQNNCFFQDFDTRGGQVTLGYASGIGTLTYNDNISVGGHDCLVLQSIATINGDNNQSYQPSGFDSCHVRVSLPGMAGNYGNGDGNTYHRSDTDAYVVSGGLPSAHSNFAVYQSRVSIDQETTATAIAMPDTVRVLPLTKRAGYANVAVYAFSDPANIDIDLSTTGLVNDQAFVIKNAFDPQGDLVYSGTYDSGDPIISVPLADMEGVVQPIAVSGFDATIPTTVPNFAALMVRPVEVVEGVPGQPTGLTVTRGRGKNTSLTVTWTLADGLATDVLLQRSIFGSGSWTDIELGEVETYTDTDLATGTVYQYRVQASNGSGDSAFSGTVTKSMKGIRAIGNEPAVSD